MNKQPIIFGLIIFYMLFQGHSEAQELNPSDREALKVFFKTLFIESEGGYVFFEKKPVCINGYFFEDLSRLGTASHLHSTIYREGLRIYNAIPHVTDSKYKIHTYRVPDSLVSNCVHFLFIHKPRLEEEIKNNLALFQYVLGPCLTVKSLIQELTSPDKPFHKTIKEDKALIGIILGFGTENSLAVSRAENISDSMFQAESPPGLPIHQKIGLNNTNQNELMLISSSFEGTRTGTALTPSLGFKSLAEESEYLNSVITISSNKLAQAPAPFMFGRLKDKDIEMIHTLEQTKDKIQDFLNSNHFLESLLYELTGNQFAFDKPSTQGNLICLPIEKNEVELLPGLIAKLICQILEGENDSYVHSFFEGMTDASKNIKPKPTLRSNHFRKNRILAMLKKRISSVDQMFASFKTNPDYSEIIPSRLYIHTKKEGGGQSIVDETLIKARYSIWMGSDEKVIVDHLTDGLVQELDLSSTISGFAYGVRGMKCGEIREIYIHPSLGYGLFTTLPKGEYIKAIVELIEITPQYNHHFPEIVTQDLDLKLPAEFDDLFLLEIKDDAYNKGYGVWSHFKNSADYTFGDVLERMEKVNVLPKEELILKDCEQDLINKLHWNLYRKSGKF